MMIRRDVGTAEQVSEREMTMIVRLQADGVHVEMPGQYHRVYRVAKSGRITWLHHLISPEVDESPLHLSAGGVDWTKVMSRVRMWEGDYVSLETRSQYPAIRNISAMKKKRMVAGVIEEHERLSHHRWHG